MRHTKRHATHKTRRLKTRRVRTRRLKTRRIKKGGGEETRAEKLAKMRQRKEERERKEENEEEAVVNLLDENLARAESADNKYHISKEERAANDERLNQEYGNTFANDKFKFIANSPYKHVEKKEEIKEEKKGFFRRLLNRGERKRKNKSPPSPANKLPPYQPRFNDSDNPNITASNKKSSTKYDMNVGLEILPTEKGEDINVGSYKSSINSPKANSSKTRSNSVRRSVKRTRKLGTNVANLVNFYEGSKP